MEFNHSWADNARWCADRRYFIARDEHGYGSPQLIIAYEAWQALSAMSTAWRPVRIPVGGLK